MSYGYCIDGDAICAGCAHGIEADSITPLRKGVCECCGDSFAGDRDGGTLRREIAREEGMLHGVDAYNDAMGYHVEDPARDWGPEEMDAAEARAARVGAYRNRKEG